MTCIHGDMAKIPCPLTISLPYSLGRRSVMVVGQFLRTLWKLRSDYAGSVYLSRAPVGCTVHKEKCEASE